MRIVVGARASILASDVSEDEAAELRSLFEHDNPEWMRKRRMRVPTYDEPRRYVTWSAEGTGASATFTFPRGGLARIVDILAKKRKVEIVDERTRGALVDEAIPDYRGYKLRPYQLDMIAKGIAAETCLLRAATGSGKTSCALAIAARLKVPTIVLVRDSALMRQWVERAETELGIAKCDVGIVREDRIDLRPLTIAMQQTLHAIFRRDEREARRITSAFGALIYDEVQESPAASCLQVIDRFPARWRIGISADEKRKDGKEFLAYDLFGDVACEAPYERLVDEGWIVDVEVRVVPTSFASDHDARDFGALVDEMVRDPSRERTIDRIVAGEVANRRRVVVLTHRRDHAVRLDARFAKMGIRSGTMIGGKADEGRFAECVAKLRSGEFSAAAATVQAFGKAIDVPELEVGVAATPLAANKQKFCQARGRFCRAGEGKKGARLYYLYDESVFGLKHLRSLAGWCRRCVVLDDGRWVPAREYLRARRRAAA